jgi:class 3 adenylate cyclase
VKGAAERDRARSAWLANKKQELVVPVTAILELSDMLLKDGRERGHDAFVADLDQIQASGKHLLAMMCQVLDPANLAGVDGDLARRIRHDLRTPLTHILGLCEIWLEDADEQFLDGFVEDLRRMHTLGRQLLSGIDELLRLGEVASDPEIDLDRLAPPPMIEEVVISLTPRPGGNGGPSLTLPARPGGALLVVEDNEVNRDVLRRRLTREGHDVTLARNGREALDLLAARAFDLILLDIIMPELNGFQVLERLKGDERLRHIPVIAISAFGEMDGIVRCIEMGAEDYLTKPFDPVLLRARIGACLEKKRLRDREVLYLEQIKKEQQRTDELLHVILPTEIVTELKANDKVRPRRYEDVAVLFCDIVGFTYFCDRNRPEDVVPHLQELIEAWEEIALRHQVEKIKTVGDAFMAAAGLLKPADNPVLNCVRCGLEMVEACRRLSVQWDVRVGVHVGPVVAGVIGRRQYLFDLWGDTVNVAARMESHGVPGSVTLSGAAWERIAHCAAGEARGLFPVKGKGPVPMVRFERFVSPGGAGPSLTLPARRKGKSASCVDGSETTQRKRRKRHS